jgi:hypothetical protein
MTTMTKIFGLCALLLFSEAVAFADPVAQEAQRHLERGLRKYKAEDYPAAIREFQAGYECEPWPEFIFALAQARRLSGDCSGALEAYHRYLATSPAQERVDRTLLEIRRCELALANAPKAPPLVDAPRPAPATAPPAGAATSLVPAPASAVAPPLPQSTLVSTPPSSPSPSRRSDAPARRWYADVFGEVAVSLGAAAVVGGALVGKAGSDAAHAINGAPDWATFDSLSAGRQTSLLQQGLGIGVATVGGALFVAGAIHWTVYLAHHPTKKG